MKDGFLLYKSFWEPISRLTDKQLGRLFRAIFLYQIDGSTQVDADIQMAFSFFKNQMDIDKGKYQKVVERNKLNGSKGGRPSKRENPGETPKPQITQKTQSVFWEPKKPKKADNENEYDNLSLIDSSFSTTPTARAYEGENDDTRDTEPGKSTEEKEKSCAKKEKEPTRLPADAIEYIRIDEVADYLKSDQSWLEALCMNRHLQMDYVLSKIGEFAVEVQLQGETVKDKRDCKRHFNNWLRKNRTLNESHTDHRASNGDITNEEVMRRCEERIAGRLAREKAREMGQYDDAVPDPF